MKTKLILTISILTVLLAGCTPLTQPDSVSEKSEVTDSIQLSAENIFGGMQRYIEHSFQTCFADYYFNKMSKEMSNYFYNKADADEIFDICQKIYNADFQYDELQVEETDGLVKITLPVNVLDGRYVISYEGICQEAGEYTFNVFHLFDKSGQDLAEDTSINIQQTITEKDSYKIGQWEEKTAYYEEQGWLQDWPEIYNSAQNSPTVGKYYLNGKKDEEVIEILPDNQISISAMDNTYYYKCIEKENENVLIWLYSLNLNPFKNLQVYPYQLEYEGDLLFYNNQKYILE